MINFADPQELATWRSIDDRVMGGISTSRLRHDPAGFAVFEGLMSLDQGGGFCSVRGPCPGGFPAGTQGLVLEVCGDGKAYKLSLRMDQQFDGISHQAGFRPPAGIWVKLVLHTRDFIANFHGRQVPGAPPLALDQVSQIGLVIARQTELRDDQSPSSHAFGQSWPVDPSTLPRQDGPFSLAIRGVKSRPD